MRKSGIFLFFFTLAAGAGGFFLRRLQLETVFDPVSGLAEPFAPATIYLAALCAAVFVVYLLFALRSKSLSSPSDYARAFETGPVPLLISFILCAMVMAAVWLHVAGAVKAGGKLNIPETILAVFAAASGLSCLFMSYSSFTRRGGNGQILCSLVPVLFACYWLILTYRAYASEPAILRFVYELTAIGAIVLGFYFSAGFVFGRPKPARAILFSHFAAFSSFLVLADDMSLSKSGFFLFCGLTLLFTSSYLMSNLVSKRRGQNV